MKTKSNNSNHKFGWKYFDLHVPDNDETVLVVYRPEKDYHKEIEYGFGKYKDGKWAAQGSNNQVSPWLLVTQMGYTENWNNKIQTNINLEQDLTIVESFNNG